MLDFLEKIKINFLDKNNKISASRLLWYFRKNQTERDLLKFYTPNCKGDENFMERIFWIENGLKNYLKCANPKCNNNLEGVVRWKDSDYLTHNSQQHYMTCSNPCKYQLHSLRTETVHKKRVKTWLKIYGVDSAAKLETNKFKVANPMKNPTSIEKAKKTCLEKFGVDNPSKSPEIINKIKEKANRPLNEQLAINNKREATCLKKYGKTHTVKLNEIQNKIKNTYLKKYGVTHNSQVTEIFEKMNKNGYTSKDYIFPSGKVVRIRGYEWKALDELLKIYDESEIEVATKKIPKIKYYWSDGSEHYYFPDIYIKKENLLIEVKSDYTMLKDFEKNQRKAVATKENGYNFKFMIYEG